MENESTGLGVTEYGKERIEITPDYHSIKNFRRRNAGFCSEQHR